MIGEEERHGCSGPHGLISDFVWAKPKSALTSKGLTNNLHEDQCILLVDNFRSASWDPYSTQRGVCVWVLGKFEDALDSSSQSKDGAQNGVS